MTTEIRINLSKAAPAVYEALGNLDRVSSEYVSKSGLSVGFAHLLRLRASQLNQCAFCVRMHTRDALKNDESSDRVSVLPAWRETDYFTAKERAALALCEAVTFIADGQVSESVYADAAGVLTNEEIAAVEWLTVVINAWNRVAIPSRYPVKP